MGRGKIYAPRASEPKTAAAGGLDGLLERLVGCYVAMPTMFRDSDPEAYHAAIRRHVSFLRGRGVARGNGVLLAGGAAGDFSTVTFGERASVAGAAGEAAESAVSIAMKAQTIGTRELVWLARIAHGLGFDNMQVSCPFYFSQAEEDFLERVAAAVPNSIIVYHTFWTSAAASFQTVAKLIEIPNVIGLKWATPRTDAIEFEDVVSSFASRVAITDNHLMLPLNHVLGAPPFAVHLSDYWPEWGVRLVAQLDRDTSGDGYPDKLCMELIGLGSSRCRPPTRDIRLLPGAVPRHAAGGRRARRRVVPSVE